MSVDIKQALRPVLCLANPSRMQAARWERLDTKQALRPVSCLPNPSELRPKEVPAGQGARWERLDTKQALRPILIVGHRGPPVRAAQGKTVCPAKPRAHPRESERAATEGSPGGTGRAVRERGHKTG